MNNTYSQSSQSPRYTEVGSNGRILRQSPIVPPEVLANHPTLQGSMAYNSPSTNTQWSNYPYQSSNKKQWWQYGGQFRPYRTTYQDYGPRKNQFNSSSAVFYTEPNGYRQGSNLYDGSWNSFGTTPYSGQNSLPYDLFQSSQYW